AASSTSRRNDLPGYSTATSPSSWARKGNAAGSRCGRLLLAGRRERSAFDPPPFHEIGEALFRRHGGAETEQSLRLSCRRQPARHRIDRTLRREFRLQAAMAHDGSKRCCELRKAGFGPAGNVEHLIGNLCPCPEDIRTRNVADMNEIHG